MIRGNESREEEMRSRLVPAVILALGFGVASAARAEEGAKDVDARWVKAMKANDVDALVACYAPDAVMWLPDAPEARGAKAIRDTYAGLLGAHRVVDAVLSDAVYNTSGDMSTAWGHFVLTLKPTKGGDNVVMKGRFLAVARKSGGKWAYVADLASNDPPPPPPPGAAK
jgi:ketosteroid isomerase-like protein